MKDSGVEWLNKIPSTWDIKKLKLMVSNKVEKLDKVDNHIDLENIESDTGRIIDSDAKIIGDLPEENPQGISFNKGNILFGKLRPYLNKFYFCTDSGTCSSEFLVLCSEGLNTKYFYGLVQTPAFVKYCIACSYGVKMPRTTWKYVREFQVPVPSKDEQNFIGETIFKINDSINNFKSIKTKQIGFLKEYEKSLIHQVVTKGLDPKAKMKDSGIEWIGKIPQGWEKTKIKNVLSDIVCGGTPKTTNDSYWSYDTGTGWVNIADMTAQEIITKTSRLLTDEGIASKGLVILPAGTLIYSIFATLGKTSVLGIPAATNQAIVGLIPNYRINQRYLRYLMTVFEKNVLSISDPNTQENLNITKVKNIEICLPTKTEQERIVKRLDPETSKIHRAVNNIETEITKLEEYRKSLIYEIVTGKVKVS
jgi:type I restriction enzyme S subunit